MHEKNFMMIPDENIMSKIYLIRGQKVMLDMDLAELYGLETKQLKRSVRRNAKRFPPDFMFELTEEEFDNLRCQIGTSNWGGARYTPMAFTEQGVAMLSSILNSERAILVNIQIIRTFTKMRELLMSNKELNEKFHQIQQELADHDEKILLIFEYLKQLEQAKHQEDELLERRRIGFKS